MKSDFGKLTVFFEEPFWVGIFERYENGRLSAAKLTFGAEPKDFEVYEFVLKQYHKLVFSPAVKAEIKEQKINPKRMQREITKVLENHGVGTKSQQALKMQYEQGKQDRKIQRRKKRNAEEERQFELRQQKKKEKHKGR